MDKSQIPYKEPVQSDPYISRTYSSHCSSHTVGSSQAEPYMTAIALPTEDIIALPSTQ